jgi:AraC-like DNA-binding protein/mannose-6-phosphate isomerase-like protein (cupin superfamily)
MENSFQKVLMQNITEAGDDFSPEVFRVISFDEGYHFKMHSHKRIELNYILKGSCIMMLDNEIVRLNENNSILIFPGSRHDFFVNSKLGIRIVQLEFYIDDNFFAAYQNVLNSELQLLQNLRSARDTYIKLPNNPEIRDCMSRIIRENKLRSKKSGVSLSQLYFIELIILLSRHLNSTGMAGGDLENEYLARAINLIHANFCSALSVDQIARECGITTRYLHKLFYKYLETSPRKYCNNIKIRKSLEMLADQTIPIKEIAYGIGCSTPQYFSRMFREQYNISPQEYRKIIIGS